jgi:hypothetical protein
MVSNFRQFFFRAKQTWLNPNFLISGEADSTTDISLSWEDPFYLLCFFGQMFIFGISASGKKWRKCRISKDKNIVA